MENRIWMGNWSLRVEIGRFQKEIYAVEIGLEQSLVAVSYQVIRDSDFCKRGKNKDCFVNKQYFFLKLPLNRPASRAFEGDPGCLNPY
jgi:hypothetical protein